MDVHQEIEALRQRIAELERGAPQDRLCLCVFSGELDRVLAALVIATGAAASGMEVCVFFTFWGTSALRDPRKRVPKGMLGHMFGAFLPMGTQKLKLSQMHFLGMGRALIRRVMRQQNVASVDELIDLAGQLGVRFMICSMSMELMSLSREEMIDYPHLETCGVASFVELSASAKSTLFV